MKIDCSITENFLKEYRRMCDSYKNCDVCPLIKYRGNGLNCFRYFYTNPREVIRIVQTWSDRNQPEIDWTKVPIDTPVLVKDKSDAEWIERYFVAYLPNANEKFCAFNDGDTRENTGGVSCWNECRLATDVDPTPFINKE